MFVCVCVHVLVILTHHIQLTPCIPFIYADYSLYYLSQPNATERVTGRLPSLSGPEI